MGLLLPFFWIGRAIGLIDSYVLVILVLVAKNQPFTIWMLRSFFMDIPRELEEAATIDGANRLTAFTKVIIPIMWPGIISASLFTLLLAYHEFLLVRLLTTVNWTLPVAISSYASGEDPGQITLAAAAAVSTTLPILLVILFFQKHLVAGLTQGAVKG
jgi:multiple sugar transport system permease protein